MINTDSSTLAEQPTTGPAPGTSIRSIVVYCGSNNGARDAYREAAIALAETLAERDITLVYGGGNIGLMGALANTMLARGGRVIGVIPHQLARLELAHEGCTELHLTENMHQRKALMAEHGDAVIALPGGLGTMEELFEALTWTQLGFHSKPCGLLNINGYFDHLLAFLDHTVSEHFVRPLHRDMLLVDQHADGLIDQLQQLEIPDAGKWLESEVRSLQS